MWRYTLNYREAGIGCCVNTLKYLKLHCTENVFSLQINFSCLTGMDQALSVHGSFLTSI